MNGRSIGYARVSTDDQNLTLQIDALTKHGIPASQIFKDKLSGAKCDRPGLAKCLDIIQSGDILVVWRLDRLGRSMRHLITLVEDLRDRGVGFRSLQEGAIRPGLPRWRPTFRPLIARTEDFLKNPCAFLPSNTHCQIEA